MEKCPACVLRYVCSTIVLFPSLYIIQLKSVIPDAINQELAAVGVPISQKNPSTSRLTHNRYVKQVG